VSIAGFVDADVDKIFGVFRVENRIIRIENRWKRRVSQNQIGDAVKRSAPDFMDVLRAGQIFDAPQHFARGAIGKSREQNSLRRNALFDQISDAVSYRARFARSRARDDERGFRFRRDDAKLLGV
jgi:hypothetical protein